VELVLKVMKSIVEADWQVSQFVQGWA
jgi:hypothetical protein